MPSLLKREKDLDQYIEMALPICLDNFKIFENESFSVNGGDKVNSSIEIGENFIDLDIILPLKIIKGDKIHSLEEFSIMIENKVIYESYELGEMIVKGSEEGVCINCFSKFALENDFFVATIPSEEDILILIESDSYKLNGVEYELIFRMKL